MVCLSHLLWLSHLDCFWLLWIGCCCEHLCTSLHVDIYFCCPWVSIWKWNCWVMVVYVFKFLRAATWFSKLIALSYYQQWARVSVFPYSCQHLVLSVFFNFGLYLVIFWCISWAFLVKVLGGACCHPPQGPREVGQVFALGEGVGNICLIQVLFEVLEDLCVSSSFILNFTLYSSHDSFRRSAEKHLVLLVASEPCSDPLPSPCISWAMILWSAFTCTFKKRTIRFLFAPAWIQVHVTPVHDLCQEDLVVRHTLRSPSTSSLTHSGGLGQDLVLCHVGHSPRSRHIHRRTTTLQSQKQHRARWQREASLGRIASQVKSAGPQARCGPLMASCPCLGWRHGAVEKAVSLQWDLAQALPSSLPEEGSPWLGSGAYQCHLTADGKGATPPSPSGWELCSEWVFKAK